MREGQLGYALIGAGGFGDYCLSHFSAMKEIRPVAVWNRTAEKGRALAARHGIRFHGKLEDLLADTAVDVVHVVTTPDQHAPHALAALRAGKHVLVEKPLAVAVGDGEEMVRLAAEKGLRLAVNFMMRYGPLAVPVRELIAGGALGALLRGQLHNCAGDEGLVPGHWFWDTERSGGIFVEHGVHFFDLAAFWLGGGMILDARSRRRPGSEVVDQVWCTAAYGEQSSFGFYHGFHQASRLDRQEIVLVFERGEVRLRGWVADRLEAVVLVEDHAYRELERLFPRARVEVIEDLSGRLVHRRWQEESMGRLLRLEWAAEGGRDDVYGGALRALLADLSAAVRDPGHGPLVSGREGLEALRLARRAEEMAAEGSE
ncbi:MAG: Gfo/Idh/MocA family oxidoreductase [Planctomycetota bacterium]